MGALRPLRASGWCAKRGQIKGVPSVSETDSFIEEVTEEVRRDRLFAQFRKYGWIGVLAVLVIVGGAGFSEYRKAQTRAAAEASGDALLAALQKDAVTDRIGALSKVDTGDDKSQMIARFLLATELAVGGRDEESAEALTGIGTGEEIAPIYRQIAAFKALAINAGNLSVEDRRMQLEALAQPGAPLRLLAEEQLALLELEGSDTDAAIERLKRVIADAEVTPGLRQRATQLIVVLGGEAPGTETAGQ